MNRNDLQEISELRVHEAKQLLDHTEVRVLGPKAVYKKICFVINKLPENSPKLETKDITVADMKAPLIALLKAAISTGKSISGIRFSRNTINGHYREDAYVYRLP